MVGTWSLDQTLLWTPGTNATTGEHVDLSDLGLVGAQLDLVKAVQATGKPTVVVLVSGKPVAEPWIQASTSLVPSQTLLVLTSCRRRRCHPAVLPRRARWSCTRRNYLWRCKPIRWSIPFKPIPNPGGLTICTATGKLPVSFPRSVGTTPVFYNYIKGSRPLDPGMVQDDGTLVFGHQASRPCSRCRI